MYPVLMSFDINPMDGLSDDTSLGGELFIGELLEGKLFGRRLPSVGLLGNELLMSEILDLAALI